MKKGLTLSFCLAFTLAAQNLATDEERAPKSPEAPTQRQLPMVRVIGEEKQLSQIPGSGSIVDTKTLEKSRVFTVNEALRKVSGLNVRDEEGFALRPNIGIRGLNPTRSTKVLLLEDGLPLSYAPYGDNASYYHPPIERFERIEVLKGAGQIRFGPQTVGGVINYITPMPTPTPTAKLTFIGGNRDYFNAHLNFSGFANNAGYVIDYSRKQGQGARDNTVSYLNDLNLKTILLLTASHALTAKANVYTEDSQVTYSGLTKAEFEENPRQNPFLNDRMVARRFGSSLSHSWNIFSTGELVTSLYGAYFTRDWWRQSSNSAQRPNDASDPNCAGMANLLTTCGNEGRLRNYYTYGAESRFNMRYQLFESEQSLETGMRAHYEIQDRRQVNGDFPNSRVPGSSPNAGLVEDNERKANAYSGFITHRFVYGPMALTPGVRVEHMIYERTNRLLANQANGGRGVYGKTQFTEIIPGAGIDVQIIEGTTLFAGVHKGFSPPRVEDIISNTTGEALDLDPERSINYEAGVRSKILPGIYGELTYFRMDFQNQIVPASVAGGVGATFTNAGRTLHQGIESEVKLSLGEFLQSRHDVFFTSAVTYLPTAKYEGTRFSSVGGFTTVSVSGNRLPYAPEWLITSTIGYASPWGFDVRLEQVYVSEMFSDDLNTQEVVPNGQRGKIPSYVIYNLAMNYELPWAPVSLFFTIKNLTDELYIADRSRGTLPGTPRLIQGGLSYRL
ncbi:MAG: TonB-dependent receptor [Leptospiraceae bacterium]|nr:TonB-dependent receptor [Leptospiraceae bacterium]MDW8307269.1 TonB-dependent receptor [Leptospiraceae bacterium]